MLLKWNIYSVIILCCSPLPTSIGDSKYKRSRTWNLFLSFASLFIDNIFVCLSAVFCYRETWRIDAILILLVYSNEFYGYSFKNLWIFMNYRPSRGVRRWDERDCHSLTDPFTYEATFFCAWCRSKYPLNYAFHTQLPSRSNPLRRSVISKVLLMTRHHTGPTLHARRRHKITRFSKVAVICNMGFNLIVASCEGRNYLSLLEIILIFAFFYTSLETMQIFSSLSSNGLIYPSKTLEDL